LKLVADVCRQVSRPADVPCRYGGDEFLLILPGKGRRAALSVARRISATVGQSEFVTESGEHIPVSLATLPQDAATTEQLIVAADSAMYQAKRRGTENRPGTSAIGEARATDTAFGILDGLVQAIDAKDRYTKRHSDVVAEYAVKLAARLDLSQDAARALRTAGLLHDIGKLAVPDELLKKPAALSADEYDVVKRHVTIGEVLIREVPQLKDVIQAVSCHHERYDGGGYPRGLKGKRIPLLGRVIAVADAYSAMSLDRPYRKALDLEDVLRELREGAGGQFDPEIVQVFQDLVLEEIGHRRMAA
jgi:putative nucleotidyltransferase with HDIG domain